MKINEVVNTSSYSMTKTDSISTVDTNIPEIQAAREVPSQNIQKEFHNEPINDELMNKSVDQANQTLEIYHRKIERSIHEKTHAVMYVIKDTNTDEVICEFPSKKIQDMIAKMWEMAGLFVDEKA